MLAACGPPQPFPASPFWQPIPAGAEVDPDSAAYISDLQGASTQGGRLHLNLTSYNVAVYRASASTPRVPLRVRQATPHSPSEVPIPAGALPAAGGEAEREQRGQPRPQEPGGGAKRKEGERAPLRKSGHHASPRATLPLAPRSLAG